VNRTWLVAFAACCAAGACTFDGLDQYTPGPDAGDGAVEAAGDAASDQVSIDVVGDIAPPPPCNLSAPFGNITPLTSLNTTNFIEGQAALSPDELTVYFLSNRLNAGSNVFTASRPNLSSPFGSVAPLTSLNFAGADTWNVTLTGDALRAYFVTDQGGLDRMYTATRASSLVGFGTPSLMPQPVRLGEQPFVRPDGQALYYSNTAGYIVRATLQPTPAVVTVGVSVAGRSVGIPVINPTETVLYFAAFDPSNIDTYDIWTSSRATANDAWSAPAPVTELNTTSFEVPSWISADGCRIYYTHGPPADAGGDWDLYFASRP